MRIYGSFSTERGNVSSSAPLASFDDIAEETANLLLDLGIVWAEVSGWYISVHGNGAPPHEE